MLNSEKDIDIFIEHNLIPNLSSIMLKALYKAIINIKYEIKLQNLKNIYLRELESHTINYSRLSNISIDNSYDDKFIYEFNSNLSKEKYEFAKQCFDKISKDILSSDIIDKRLIKYKNSFYILAASTAINSCGSFFYYIYFLAYLRNLKMKGSANLTGLFSRKGVGYALLSQIALISLIILSAIYNKHQSKELKKCLKDNFITKHLESKETKDSFRKKIIEIQQETLYQVVI